MAETMIDRLLLKIDVDIDKFDKGMKSIEQGLMSAGLSFLFTGMAIKRLFQTALTAMLTTFIAVEGETSAASDSVGELMASWEFLKWSLMDAAVSAGIFDIWIERINRLINLVNNLTTEQKAQLTDWMVLGVIGASALMFIGQAMLGLLGIIGFFKYLLLGIGKIIFAIFGSPFLLALSAIVIAFGLMYKRIGNVWDTLKAFGIFALAVLAFIGDAIREFFLLPLRAVIATINLIIKAFHALGMLQGVSTIAQPEAFGLSKSVAGMRDRLLAEADRKKEITNNITIEGNADQNTIDKLISALEHRLSFSQGSPQG